jgi:iron(III) transport system ATP-binding protein
MLSGGEQQRVALARAMAPRPRIMLMDEPFSGLDNRLRDGIRDETLQLLKEDGTAVILVTHEPEEAMRMGDQIALMRNGSDRAAGRALQRLQRPLRPGCGGVFQRYQRGDGHGAGRADDDALRRIPRPRLSRRSVVDIVFRPQHVKIDFDRGGRGPNPTPQDGVPARGVVRRARFMGTKASWSSTWISTAAS